MKRFVFALLAITALGAAFVALAKVGVFQRRESPYTPKMEFNLPRGFGTTISPSEVPKVLQDWTYPGAHEQAHSPTPRLAAGGKGNLAYTRYLVSRDPFSKIDQFYDSKCEAPPSPAAPDAVLKTQWLEGGAPDIHKLKISADGQERQVYTRVVVRYTITAEIMHKPDSKLTVINLSLQPARALNYLPPYRRTTVGT